MTTLYLSANAQVGRVPRGLKSKPRVTAVSDDLGTTAEEAVSQRSSKSDLLV
jgi:hypothetical protein